MKGCLRVVLCAALLLAGCKLVAPLELVEPDGADAGADEGPCQDGEVRCAGRTPQVCEEGQYVTQGQGDCMYACDDESGECIGECKNGDAQCRDGAVEECQNNEWVNTEKCEGTCQAGECITRCEEGTRTCAAEQQLQECVDGEFVDLMNCEGVCREGACSGECRPEATRCSEEVENTPELCDEDGEWVKLGECQNDTFCVDGECAPCDPGSKRCVDGVPNDCNAAGELQPAKPCEAPMPACFEGKCVACVPGSKRCVGNVLEQCNDQAMWEELEQCAGDTPACIPALESCGLCNEGDRSCDADTPQVCNDRGEWVQEAPCAEQTPQCIGEGACVECDPSETPRRCLDDTNVQVCNEQGQWGEVTACLDPALPTCHPETKRCGCTDDARRCTDPGPSSYDLCVMGEWVSQPACEGTTPVCLDATGLCVECEPGNEKCVDNIAHGCDQDGQLQSLNSCAGSMVNCGGCDLGESCDEPADCNSNNCVSGTCRVPEDCTNGIDDDGDGQADCADTFCTQVRCLELPSGWQGPVVVATTELVQFPAQCPSEFPQEALALQGDPTAADVSCSACTCDDSLSCDGAEVQEFDACDMSPPTQTTAVAEGECFDLQLQADDGLALVGGLVSGSCGLQGGGEVTDAPAPSWNLQMRACEQTSSDAVGCEGTEFCVTSDPPSDYEGRYCVYALGDVSCPGGYPNKRLFFTEFDDTRDCSPCSCDASGDCATDAWQPYDAASCGGNALTPVSACAGDALSCPCQAPPSGAVSLSYVPGLVCAATGGEPTGGVSGLTDTGHTVCCED